MLDELKRHAKRADEDELAEWLLVAVESGLRSFQPLADEIVQLTSADSYPGTLARDYLDSLTSEWRSFVVPSHPVKGAGVLFDPSNTVLEVSGEEIALSEHEFAILEFLFHEGRDRTVSWPELLSRLRSFVGSRAELVTVLDGLSLKLPKSARPVVGATGASWAPSA